MTPPPTGTEFLPLATSGSASPGVRYVYALLDDLGRARYVGQAKDAPNRLRSHWRKVRDPAAHGPLADWLRTLATPPAVAILEAVPAADAVRVERDWILRLRAVAPPDAPLLNVRPYVDGWPGLTDEHRAKIGAANRGKRLSPEAREKIAAAHRGRPLSAEHRAALSAGHRGVPFTPEHRAALSASLRAAHDRRREAEARRAALSEAVRRSWRDPEVRARRELGVRDWWARRRAASVVGEG